ncbi:cadmium-translocating P-type ATPase [Luteimonas yindakuii]|uniref:heavy metal translocating P-type ATPase n=1 Tax=Luteimonas yindakuii TaxID=2565782 RepID=UPI0010A30C76|nr:heavy metal translocating P-type ATPase [Luteimonas yindakuii]QCO68325.1 cadmium-translocating P-type ATPase [Luteimonas yindakuii]
MSATLSGSPESGAARAADGTCHHCSEPLPAQPARLAIDGQAHEFCCEGCAAAARWIGEARLGDYYRLRTAPATRIDPDGGDLSLWDREEVLAEHARAVPRGREITLLTDGMRCAACAWLIDRVLAREPGIIDSGANAVTGRIRLSWDPARTTLSTPLARLAALGYRPYLATGEARERERRRQRNRDLLRIGIAGLGAMQAMMMAEALYLDIHASMLPVTRDFFRWLTFLLSTPVVFYAGWLFIAGAWRELSQRRLGMDVLIAGSTLLAWAASVFETVRGGTHVWYDAAVMFVFLLLLARMLEQRARARASAQVDALARARPAFAERERDDGSRETVPVAALARGDIACVAVGGVVPADGILLEPSRFEEALLTGEWTAVAREAGERVYAGTLCRERPARLRVDETGTATRLSQLTALVEAAQAQRPPLALAGERIAHHFVAALLVTAVCVYVGWRIHDPSRALEVVLALLVISCPCALALAVPTALATAHGALARIGVLALGERALERLAAATDIVFDKTGTLSDGRPVLAGIETFDGFERDTALAIAAALERDSGHPLAQAFAGIDGPQAMAVQAHAGAGIEGTVDGVRWRLGHAGFAAGQADDEGIRLGDGTRAIAHFRIEEAARRDAADTVAQLRALGLRVHLSSGDADAPVHAFAARLGIEHAHARQRPEDKLGYARALQAQSRVVAMVGDGVNDAPVLAGADVSLAMAEGAPLAQQSADLVLTGRTLQRVPQAIAIARRTRQVIRQNLAWAAGYNVIAVPLAAAGWVTPWLAALGMALSSLLVVGNALRLARMPVQAGAKSTAQDAAGPRVAAASAAHTPHGTGGAA